MPPAVAGFITSIAAALCYGMCVTETKLSQMVQDEEPINLEGEDIEVNDAQTVSSVGASTVLQEAAQDGFFGNHCFLEISPNSTDAFDKLSIIGTPSGIRKR